MIKSYFSREYILMRVTLICSIVLISNLTWALIATSSTFSFVELISQKDFFSRLLLGILETASLVEIPFYLVWKSLSIEGKYSIRLYLISFILSFTISLFFSWIFTWFGDGESAGGFFSNFASDIAISFLATVVSTIIIHKNMVAELMKEKERILQEKMRLAEANAIAQEDAMNMRIDNHFFFNSFSVLAALIGEDPKKAEDFLLELTDTHRSIMMFGAEKTIPLYKELTLLESYMKMTRYRFGEECIHLTFSPEIDEHKDGQIIPLALLHLVENAIKHNSYNDEHPLTITVEFEKIEDVMYLTVTNNKQEKISKPASTHQGLDNIRRKQLLVTGQAPIIEDSAEYFTVKIPVIEKWTY